MPRTKTSFRKGQGGRKPGALGKGTLEGRALASHLLDDADYREKFRARLVAGELPPTLEAMLWAYAFGKPRDLPSDDAPMEFTLDLDGPIGRVGPVYKVEFDK